MAKVCPKNLLASYWMQQMKLVVPLKKDKILIKWQKLIRLLHITDINFIKRYLSSLLLLKFAFRVNYTYQKLFYLEL